MPTAAPRACSVPRCPGAAVDRGRCELHRLSEAERGYGAAHRRDRRDARPGARCEACGCTRNLQRDHIVPASLGGPEVPSNKRWLCRCPEHGCHDRLGVRRDRPRASRDFGHELTEHAKGREGVRAGPSSTVSTPPPSPRRSAHA